MRPIAYISLFVMALGLAACQNTSLPRAEASESERFKVAGDQVFEDVYEGPGNVLHSLMILDEGKVVYEKWNIGYSPDQLQVMWSISKTFTALAVGFAQQEGLLHTEDKVMDYFDRSELPSEPDSLLDGLTLHDLLIMSSGLSDCSYRTMKGEVQDWAMTALCEKFCFKPGEMFQYNNMNAYILSVIISRLTGMKMAEYLNRKLFVPLGIEDYHWLESPQGYNAGGWGLYLTTEDLAKVGQFFLDRGRWQGKELLGEDWFVQASYPHIVQYKRLITDPVETDPRDQWRQGYGYQMWNCTDGAVRMHGAQGQLCIIFPDKNAVVVTTANCSKDVNILDSIWKNIYPLL